nr:MAG TPA: hypothetical protein [Caudoviricetes sp.]
MDIRRGKSTKLTGYPHIHCSDFNSDPKYGRILKIVMRA